MFSSFAKQDGVRRAKRKEKLNKRKEEKKKKKIWSVKERSYFLYV